MHFRDAGMAADERRGDLLDQPVDLDIGPRRREVGQRRKGVDNIAEGGELDDQEAHARGPRDRRGGRSKRGSGKR